jgi:tRNA U38,U39,U40 pseudouridine synthase TruA
MATSAVSDAIRATLPSSHRYKLTIQYKGTRYKGWQNQIDDPTSKRRSIQYIIEVRIFSLSTYMKFVWIYTSAL